MKQRIKKLNRVLKVQEHLHRDAERKLSALEREALELKAAQEAILQTMNDHETLHGLFVDVAAKRLQALAGQASRVDGAKAHQRAVTVEKAMQVKRTEKMLSGLKEESRRDDEKKDLVSILERITAKASASFP